MDSGGFRGRWTCWGCGGVILPDFTQCWKCGAVRGAEDEPGLEAGAQPLLAVDPPEAVRPPSLLGMTPVFAPAPKGLWLEVAVVFLVAVLPPMVSAIWDFLVPETRTPVNADPISDAVFRTARSVGISALVLYIMARSRSTWSHFGILRPKLVLDGSLALLVYILQAGLGFFCWPFFGFLFPGTHSSPLGMYGSGVAGHLILVGSRCASAFSQELVMRAYLIPRLETLFASTGWAVLWSSVLFGAYHLYQGTASCFHTMLVGILYASAFAVTRRIWPLALAHAAWNNSVAW